ncbi:outer membrane protein assembly factor BamE [Comamonadaceae bacterium G21597-S1]|nr:outer membrane protein assembly factor BamE [Comamonadaceae bacterium G21597-S1]
MHATPVLKSLLLLAIGAGLAACSSFDGASNRLASIVTPYQIDVVQGNVITREQVDILRAGLPRQSVRDLLGTPLLQSVFHANRWDYVFSFRRKGEEPQLRRLTVYFKDDVVERFEADPMPTEAEFVASLDNQRKSAKVPELEASEEALKAFAQASKRPASDTAATPARAVPPLPASYPPLEPAIP